MPVAVAFFVSGAAALVLQVLWTRMLGHALGASALAVATVLTVFMGGQALGSHFGGRYCARVRRPLLGFALLEAGVGLYGLLVPGLLETLPSIQQHWVAALGDGRWGHALLRFFLSSAVLVAPTIAMGATLPFLAQAVVQKDEDMARRTGQLYAANTFGAVSGALLAGFYLIPQLGVDTSVRIAAVMDLAVAGIVGGLAGLGGGKLLLRFRRAERADELLFELEPIEPEPVSTGEARRVLVAFAFSGGAAMALEVLWTRAVGVVIGASTYAFTLILVTFLVGLAGGAAWMSGRVARLKRPLVVLAWVEIGVGITTLLASTFIDRLPLVLHGVTRDSGLTHVGLYASHFALTALVTLPSTLLLGTVMPLVLAAVAPSRVAAPGEIVGRAYALNTLGAITGSFLGGFVILPTLGVEHGLEACALASVATGLFVLGPRLSRHRGAIGVAAAGLALALLGPGWNVERWTAGLFRFYLARDVYSGGWESSTDIIYHRDGVATTVTVGKYPGRDDGLGVVLKVNGKVDASDVGDMPTQILSGLLPVLLHDAPEDALVIGYGSGVTPGALLQAPIERLWVAEIESGVYEAANRHFAHVNHRPFEDPRAHLMVDDGRNFLLTRDRSYDLIVSEPSNPWMSGAASLFTRDFFEIARSRLKDDGVFLQWLQLYELSATSIHTLVRTFASVFPHVLLFTPDPHSNDTFLVGSSSPIVVDAARVEAWMQNPKVRSELKRARVEEPNDLVGLYFVSEAELPELVRSGPINDDDNAYIEHRAPLDLLEFGMRDAHVPFRDFAKGRRRTLIAEGPFEGYDDSPEALVARGRRLLAQGRREDARDHAEAAGTDTPGAERLLALLDRLDGAETETPLVANEETREHEGYYRVAVAIDEGDDREAFARLRHDEDPRWERSPAHRFVKAYLMYRLGFSRAARVAFEELLAAEPDMPERHPAVLYYGARAAADDHRHALALRWMEAWLLLEARTEPAD